MLWGQKILIFSAPGQKILIFDAPGTENIDFWCSRDSKYLFLVLWGQRILIFGGPEGAVGRGWRWAESWTP